jgi:hypothetical protein
METIVVCDECGARQPQSEAVEGVVTGTGETVFYCPSCWGDE